MTHQDIYVVNDPKQNLKRLHPNSMLLVRTKDQPDRFLDRDGNEVRA